MKKLMAIISTVAVVATAAAANAVVLTTGGVNIGGSAEDCYHGADAVYLRQSGTATKRLAICANSQKSPQSISKAVQARLTYLSQKYPKGIVKTCDNPINEGCYYWSSELEAERD